MAREKSMAAIEAEIAKAKEAVLKTKDRHEAAIADLEAAMTKKDERIAKCRSPSKNTLKIQKYPSYNS